MKVILATTSPHRIATFKAMNINFISQASNIEEKFPGRPNSPEELVSELSKQKSEAVASLNKEGIVIGFDSVGCFENQISEKPKDKQDAFQRLKSLSGNTFYFYTGIHMINLSENKVLRRVVKTKVNMRVLSDEEINNYLNQDSNYKTYALAFDPSARYLSCSFIKSLEGSYHNVIGGIPLETISEMLTEIGYKKMKITLCGSIKFADKIVEIHKKLELMGYMPKIHEHMFGLVDGTAPQLNDKIETHEIKKKYDYIRAWHNLIVEGDAVLFCNFDKGEIKNYIGGNTLMEMGFAYINNKKIFLLNPIPEQLSYADEIKSMSPIILNGNLDEININL